MATSTKKKTNRMTGGQLFEAVAGKVGVKRKLVRDTLFALVDVVIAELKKNDEVRIPHLGKLHIKRTPSKVIPAGTYPNMFKKGPDGKPLMEYKEKRVRPARTKVKFNVASQVKKPILGK